MSDNEQTVRSAYEAFGRGDIPAVMEKGFTPSGGR